VDLVVKARARLEYAPAILGPIEVRGHSEMSLCCRPLLLALADIVPIGWIAGPRHVPAWLEGTKIRVIRSEAESPAVALFSCANPHHEALEAVRWARSLLASGTARPEEIAITAASPADFDDHVMALAGDANLPVHFAHGVKAVTTREG